MMNLSSPILVIGALGNVGAEVVKQLQAAGQRVRAADINVKKLHEEFGESVEAVYFDFIKPETFAATFQGVERMFLLRPPQLSNVKRDMFPAIDAAKRAGVKHVVFLSLIGIENAKFLPHYKVEEYLSQRGFQTTFLRCSFFMQNLNTTHREEIRERNEIFVPVGRAKTSFIDARDIGAVAAIALSGDDHMGKNYDLTGSETLDYWQVAQTLSEVLGRTIRYRNPNVLQFFIESLRRGRGFLFSLVTAGLYTSTRLGMADRVTNEVERLTGKKPISLKRYTQDYRKAWL